jgi:hypothetical protein
MVNHSRRLERLEERYTRGQIFVWNDYTPGCVEREFARRIREGTADPQDEIISIGWEVAV